MKTVFVPPICNWNFLKQLPQQIASQWSKNDYTVYYCNEFSNTAKIEEVEPNLFVFPNKDYALHYLHKNNIKIDIFYNTAAKNHDFVEKVNPKYVIYHSCDSFDEWKKLENSMITKSDVILCTSEFIYELRKKQHNNVHLIRNACNEYMLNKEYVKLPEFKFIKRPICTFSGACGAWVSTYLIRNVAKEYPTTFIGMPFGKAVPKNVTFYKPVDHVSMTNFLKNMDLGLLPFNIKTEIVQAANPIKMWEYLACGLPVVATNWAETNREELKDVVFIANKDEDFVDIVKQYSEFSDSHKLELKNKCIEVAQNNTWEKRFEQIKKIIGDDIC